jgi:tetratricopeptide (TPR) repeat protein
MSRLVRLALLLVVLTVHGRDMFQGLDEWFQKGKSQMVTGDYRAAIQAFRQALATANRSGVDDRTLLEIHSFLAVACSQAGQFAESEHQYRSALALEEKLQSRHSLYYAFLTGSLALLPTQTGNQDGVIALLNEAITANRHTASTQDLSVVRNRLALLLRREKRYQEEESLLTDALSELETQKAPDQRLLADSFNDLALLRFDQGRYSDSVDLFSKSIKAWQTALGPEHPSLVVVYSNFAASYAKCHRLNEAKATYELAIALCSKTLGKHHPAYEAALAGYAEVLRESGRKSEAKAVDARADQIRRESARRNGIGATVDASALQSRRK